MGLFARNPDPNVVEALASQRKLIERLEGLLVTANLELADARKAQHAAEDGLKQSIEGLRLARMEFEKRLAALAVPPTNLEARLPAALRTAAPRPAFANTSIAAGHFSMDKPPDEKTRLAPEEGAA